MRWPDWYPLAVEKVRHVGEPFAIVVAETVRQARDAAEAVYADIDPLPVVLTPGPATAGGAQLVHDDFPGNVVLDFHSGDAKKTEAAFARADHVTRLPIVSNRIVSMRWSRVPRLLPMTAERGRFTIRLASQGAFGARNMLAHVLDVAPERVRALTGNVGGSFGMKAHPLSDYCLLFRGRELGRPVKWTDMRSDSFPVRQGRLCRRDDVGDECGGRCTCSVRHPACRHACDPDQGLGSAAAGKADKKGRQGLTGRGTTMVARPQVQPSGVYIYPWATSS